MVLQSKALFDLNSSTRITLTTVASLMLSHLGRNVALSRPISLLDIKDDDNSGGRAAMSSKQATVAAARSNTPPNSERSRRWKVTKNKVVEMGSKSSALKGSSFVCTRWPYCLCTRFSKKSSLLPPSPSSSSKVDHPLVSRNFLWGHSEVSRTPRTLEARSLTTT